MTTHERIQNLRRLFPKSYERGWWFGSWRYPRAVERDIYIHSKYADLKKSPNLRAHREALMRLRISALEHEVDSCPVNEITAFAAGQMERLQGLMARERG